MKKIFISTLFIILALLSFLLSVISVLELVPKINLLVIYLQDEQAQAIPPYLSGVTKNAIDEAVGFLQSVFSFACFCYISFTYIHRSNLDHAARLTYEEYKERAKQKKLEKTRKKMQELEQKLQKESTE